MRVGQPAFVPDADEGDDEPDADHAEADVEDDVGTAASLQLVSIDGAVSSPLASADSGLGELEQSEGEEINTRNIWRI